MKATNKFKEPIVLKKEKSSYSKAYDALIGTAIIFSIAIVLSVLDRSLALGFILFCMTFILMLIRLNQKK